MVTDHRGSICIVSKAIITDSPPLIVVAKLHETSLTICNYAINQPDFSLCTNCMCKCTRTIIQTQQKSYYCVAISMNYAIPVYHISCHSMHLVSLFLFYFFYLIILCTYILVAEEGAGQVTPASSEWAQLWRPTPLWTQSASLISFPLQFTSSNNIGPVPLLKCAFVLAVAPIQLLKTRVCRYEKLRTIN